MDPTAALREYKAAFDRWMKVTDRIAKEEVVAERGNMLRQDLGIPTRTFVRSVEDYQDLAHAAQDAAETADALFSWLAGGGFAPDWSTYNEAV